MKAIRNVTKASRTSNCKNSQSTQTAIREMKLPLRSILVPIDFPDCSKKALNCAIALAKQSGGKISLIHVVKPTYPVDNILAAIPQSDETTSIPYARSRLSAFASNAIEKSLLGQLVIRAGEPFHEICETARDLESDLIVIATHGYTGLKRFFLGSTAEKVAYHAPCSVILIRTKDGPHRLRRHQSASMLLGLSAFQ